ncbi:hypothetical protein M2322_000820 [Rhodoblastus acidophilus]|uniref:hypothetical protein n=1 Tax=Rhodoblastus acidophilus TaxID=1074 RepID=UPI00222518C2|nr:hypothetical protein [Rhodoblastus acidophilus]MCW2315286.1 hypothetical protein [Rhodoblastus acidophilus]
MLILSNELSRIDGFFRRDAAVLKYEACKVTEAGPVWPVPRTEMRHPETIRERMLEDLAAIAARRTFVELYDLAEAGWPFAVIERLGPAAVSAFRFNAVA